MVRGVSPGCASGPGGVPTPGTHREEHCHPLPGAVHTLSFAPCFRITLAASLSPVSFSVHV